MTTSTTQTEPPAGGTALDLLENEDLELRRLFTLLHQKRGVTVEDRADYGDLAKDIIRHLATREAALVDVTGVLGDDPGLREITTQLESNMLDGRPHLDRVEKMSRGVQGMNLRVGQDFDSAMLELIQVIGTDIEWELGQALPQLKGSLAASSHEQEFKSAAHLEKHAPTNLNPDGPRWWETAPVVSRLITIYDRLRDFPRGSRRRI